MKTPVVLIIYHRPEMTMKVIESIRRVKPGVVFVIADGPKDHIDNKKCLETRALVQSIDWKCKIYKNYARKNSGLRRRVVSGLNWVFSKVDKAIILEDDLVADPSFFQFCEILLKKYENNSKILSISGNNFQFNNNKMEYSYYFSRYVHSWGWATWRRAWKQYDDNMTKWQSLRETNWLHKVFDNRVMELYWRKIFDTTFAGQVDSWAYRWTYSSLLNNGLTIIPKVNLVSNFGFDSRATHTTKKSKVTEMKINSVSFPLKHPHEIERSKKLDAITEDNAYLNTVMKISLFVRSFLK